MKTILAVAILTLFTAGAALAEDTIRLPAKNGNVVFQHKVHEARLPDCKPCHANEKGGKIEGLGRDWAHKNCVGCHWKGKVSPTKCDGCHKK